MHALFHLLPIAHLLFAMSLHVSFEVIKTNTVATLIAISSTTSTLWVSGTQGTIIRSTDNGLTWSDNLWTGPDTLQFRDIHGFEDGHRAIAMSIGTGASSQLFITEDAGASWVRTFTMGHPEGFLDCIDFWDDLRGLAYGDAFDGYPFILFTADGGRTWSRVLPENLPPALSDEGGFASSGSCITTGQDGRGWIGTGNASVARILMTEDYGNTWTVTNSPIIAGEAAGITAIDFTIDGLGFITGGHLAMMEAYTDNCAVSFDFGHTWSLTTAPSTPGAMYGLSIATIDQSPGLFVCGPNGIDYTFDRGSTWQNLDTANYWVVHFDSGRSVGWAAGKNGRLIKINFD